MQHDWLGNPVTTESDATLAGVNDFVQPFLTMQYLYGLARAGLLEADQLLENLRAFAARAPAFVRDVWGSVCLAACEGLLAHARRKWESAFCKMAETAPRLLEIGGSHAQRGYDPQSVPVNLALADVYAHLELPRQAAQARPRVTCH